MDDTPALLCFSHLRWNFVYQRPQHLLAQAVRTHRVFYIEEPEHHDGPSQYRMQFTTSGVTVLTPIIGHGSDAVVEQRSLLQGLYKMLGNASITHWYYTPMAMAFAGDLPRDLCIYDCMDELSHFAHAPAELKQFERDLIAQADLVFTGGASLYEAKRSLHRDTHCFPSSVDTRHFGKARTAQADPADQAQIARPRIGFFGVIDERMDLDLVALAARDMPDVQFMMLGPVVKIDPANLPQAANLHWLGCKDYSELPAYMAHWQAAWMPFALNDSTKFISPTKTPEFLAAGLRVTSTAVQDVVEGYGKRGLVAIADRDTIVAALRDSLTPASAELRRDVDAALADMSWDRTWKAMQNLMLAKTRTTVRV